MLTRMKSSAHLKSFSKPTPVPDYVQLDYEWADEHMSDLVKKYPKKWVAVVNQRVVSHGKRPDRLLSQAYRKARRPHVAFLFIEKGIHLY